MEFRNANDLKNMYFIALKTNYDNEIKVSRVSKRILKPSQKQWRR